MVSIQVLATPMIGLAGSSSVKPMAFSMARAGARSRPWVMVWLWSFIVGITSVRQKHPGTDLSAGANRQRFGTDSSALGGVFLALLFHQLPQAASAHVPALGEWLARGERFGQLANGAPVDAGDSHSGAGTIVHLWPPSWLRIQSTRSSMRSTSRSGAGSASVSGWNP